jgi:8-amino-7-oxononanoate synthase
MSYLRRVDDALAAIRGADRYRELPQEHHAGKIDFSSNDYLGLSTQPEVLEALKRATRVGSGGARLLGGRHREHALLEGELASWLGRERALLFSSGYLAAIGSIPVLADVSGNIVSDERNHASLIDGIRLARVERAIYAHGVLPQQVAPTLAISESLFGMEGDVVDPWALLAKLHAGGVLFLDEAHALGIAGPQGAGMAHGLQDPRVVVLGTLSKALGTLGGFVAGPAPVVELLVNRARGVVFDTALPPAIALAARIALMLVRKADDRRERLRANVRRLRVGLEELGLPGSGSDIAPIVPLVLGSEARALEISCRLYERGLVAPAVRPPTVPPGTSRLRFSIRADHTAEQIDCLLQALSTCIVTS